jgi:hypothetical protein
MPLSDILRGTPVRSVAEAIAVMRAIDEARAMWNVRAARAAACGIGSLGASTAWWECPAADC